MKKQFLIIMSLLALVGCPVSAEDKEDPVVGIGVAIEVKGFNDKDKEESMIVSKDHPVIVKDLTADSPAGKAGLKVGDRITKIDGKNIDGLLFKDVVFKIRGKENTQIKVTFESADGKGPQTVSIKRTQLTN
jgi:carboxyl-terminal processing protease